MKRKFLCLAAGLGLVSIAGIASLGANNGSIIMANNTKVEWHHYNAVKATATSNGSLEYWVSCADHTVQFTAPAGDNVNIVDKGDTHEEGWLATLNGDEARRTAYTPNALKSESNFWRYFRHNGWGTTDYANGVVSIKTKCTVNYELLKDAHALGIKYLYFHINGTAKENGSKIGSIPFSRESLGGTANFYTNQSWIQDGNGSYGNGNGVIINVEDFYNSFTGNRYATVEPLQTIFSFTARDTDNKDVEFDHLTLSNFETFETLEAAKAYKDLNKALEWSPTNYFSSGATPTGDGTKFVYQTNGGNFGIKKKLIDDVKAIGKTKVSFNIKMSTSEEGKTLTNVVWTTEARGTNSSGTALNWDTDWSDSGKQTNLATDGYTVTLNVNKLFGDSVTYTNDIAYFIVGRLEDQTSNYTGPDGGSVVTLTVSDFKVK